MKSYITLLFISFSLMACTQRNNLQDQIQGKVERDEIAVVGKIAGRILHLKVEEGDLVKKGDTLAILEIPEVDAKKAQASGAVLSADAQYQMARKGATANQMKQLQAKKSALTEQFGYAQKSLNRLSLMVKDSLIPQQQYDEVYAKYQGARAQLAAVKAEIEDVAHGVRIEQQEMAKGQQDRALGALQEVKVAESERFIIAPHDMTISTITLKEGELALPGYTLFKGTLDNSTYFRFTLPESKISNYAKGQEVTVKQAYGEKVFKGKIINLKQIGAYANIASASPDYNYQDMLYELKIKPIDLPATESLISKSTVILK